MPFYQPQVDSKSLNNYLLIAISFLLFSCGYQGVGQDEDSLAQAKSNGSTYEVEIRRTKGGLPHIKAQDFASLGYGTAYAVAQDDVCLLAENFLRFRGELSRFKGAQNGNFESDIFYRYITEHGVQSWPVANELQAMYQGYAAGYNRYLRDTKVENIPDSRCRGAEWVTEITADDIRRIDQTPFYYPGLQGLLVSAKPPVINAEEAEVAVSALSEMSLANIENMINPGDKGSNGVAFGRETTEQQKGLLLANPHWTWQGNQRYYPRHQTIPGVLDMLGVHTVERPLAALGNNQHVAWTVTVSAGSRTSFYQLDLVPGKPTQYLFDGEVRDMKVETVSVDVLTDAGTVEAREHTFYSTHFGYLVGQFPWGEKHAYAMRIADESGRDVGGANMELLQVKSVRELKAVHDKYQHHPANLIAADDGGEVLYADPGVMAHITDELTEKCKVAFKLALDGTRSDCQWGSDADAPVAGIFGTQNLPYLYRNDYVLNSNDSYWLSHPDQPLEGFAASIGNEKTERTLRTRSGFKMINERLAGVDGFSGNRFNRINLLQMLSSNQSFAGQLMRDDVVVLCEANPEVSLAEGAVVNISEACKVLEQWDLRANSESRGAHLFREMLRDANNDNDRWRWLPRSFVFKVPFDASKPLDTPRQLDSKNNPAVLQSLARAVQKLRRDGIALDAALGELQTVTRNGKVLPISGGVEFSGVFNKVTSAYKGNSGYPEVTSSASGWVSATEFTDNGPVVRGIQTYSISTNPESPHYSDMTEMFSRKEWLDIPFREEDVQARALTSVTLTEGVADCGAEGWQKFTQPRFSSLEKCKQHFMALNSQRVTDFEVR